MTVPLSFAICFVIKDTKLLFPMPVMASMPKCRDTILSRFTLASTVSFRKRLPMLTHPALSGPNISARSEPSGSVISVPGIGGMAGTTDLPRFKSPMNPSIPTWAVYVLSRLFISAISVLSAASS